MLQSKFSAIFPIPKSCRKRTLDKTPASRYAGGSGSNQAVKCFLTISLVVVLGCIANEAQAQSANPHAVSLYNLGLSAYKQGSPESAIIFFKRAADIDPDLADAQYNLGVLYQSERRLKEAVPRFEQVLRVKPQDQDAHFQLGLALIDLGRTSEAKQHLLSVAPNSPHFSEAQKKLASIDSGQAGQSQQLAAPGGNPPALAPPETPASPGGTPYQQPAINNPPANAYTPPAYLPANPPPNIATAVPPSVNTFQNRPPTCTPPATPNPVPLLANATVRVVATGFSAPSGLAFDKVGNLYVANFITNSIDRIASDGTKTPFVSGVNLKGPIGLVVDEAGNLYVANYFGGTVIRINPAGISTVIASGFKKPYYLTIDRDGNLFVSQQEDNSVVRITLPKATSSRPH